MIFKTFNRNFWLCSSAIFIISGNYYCSSSPAETAVVEKTSENKALTQGDLVAKGKYLVNTGGCNDCHSPKSMTAMGPVPDTTKLLSGHVANSPMPPITYDATKPGNWMLFAPDLTAAVGPWGISFSANLTPDSTTGIGAWSTENFINTMRKGKHLGMDGGRPILPPMPWASLGEMTDDDLTSMFEYLKSLPPIKNQVPAPVPPNEVMKGK